MAGIAKKPIIKDIHFGGNWLSFHYEKDSSIIFGQDFNSFRIEIVDTIAYDSVYEVTTSNIDQINHFVILENNFSSLVVGDSYEIYIYYVSDSQISVSSDAFISEYKEKMDYLTGLDAPEITQLYMIQFGDSIKIPYNSSSDKIDFDSFRAIILDNDTIIFDEITTNFDSSANIVTLEFPFYSDGIIINNIFEIGNTYSIKLCYVNSNTNTYSNISEPMNLLYSPSYIVNPPYLSQNPQYSTGNILSISYEMNVYVNTDDFNSFNIKILTEKDEEILNVTTSNFDSETITLEFPYISENGETIENPLKSGTYQLSIAYVGEYGIGNFSNTITLKYTISLNDKSPLILKDQIKYYYGDRIEIPYKNNSLITPIDFNSFKIKILLASNDNVIFENKASTYNSNKVILEFPYTETDGTKITNPLIKKCIYKVQIAYFRNEEIVGPYSELASFEYINPPNLLYPPILQGTIPACYGNNIEIPYIMNKAISYLDFDDFKVIIQSIKNGLVVFRGNAEKNENSNIAKLTFQSSSNSLKIGQFYKIQIAYNNISNTSPYSTVAIMKYTGEPTISIKGLDSQKDNTHLYAYNGIYLNENDPSEKIYSYKFTVYDNNGKIYKQSDDILYDSKNDTADGSICTYSFSEDIPVEEGQDIKYKIKFEVTTINGLQISTPKYSIKQGDADAAPIGISLSAILNYNNGFIKTIIKNSNKDSVQYNIELLRTDNKSNFNSWSKLLYLENFEINETKVVLRDYSIENGYTYKYAIRVVSTNNNITTLSEKIESQEVFADFEDMFISDGKKQLKIRFNPNVSSFKTTIQESKIDTIGSKYPYFFRNDIIGYKEFPINGLISLKMDEDQVFSEELNNYLISTDENGNKIQNLEYGLNGETFRNELNFKIKVLDWLNDGKPKIFRSSAEGNYIVRLMNVSLSPLSSSINRLVHSFSCTAYEISDFTIEHLIENNLLNRNAWGGI